VPVVIPTVTPTVTPTPNASAHVTPTPVTPSPSPDTPSPTPDPKPTELVKAAPVVFDTTPKGTAANWKQLGEMCNILPAPLMSDSCVTTDDKLAPNYKCCKGVKAKDGSYTALIYCVNTDKASFEVDGEKMNFDCRMGANSLVVGSLISFLLAALLIQ
jgi:hypothetical protein